MAQGNTKRKWAAIELALNIVSIYLFVAFFGGGIALVIDDPGLPCEWVYGPFNFLPFLPLFLAGLTASIVATFMNYHRGRNFLGTITLFVTFCSVCTIGAG